VSWVSITDPRAADHDTVACWLAACPNGRLLIAAHEDPAELRLWNVEACKEIQELRWLPRSGWDQNPTRSSFSADGRVVVWRSGDGEMRLYRLIIPQTSPAV
jgi:hypothetical protein